MPKAFSNDQSIGTSSVKGSTTKSRRISLKRNKFSGKDSAVISAFLEANCGLATTEYYKSLKRQGMKYTMDTITLVHQCQKVAQRLKNAPSKDPKPKTKHALLFNF
ncbi:hypothetical protein C8R48DRAFT_674288 [Suillus tomentosus]|nr:hypothetical protein C8R48DRAFT_674288 [Suillus tomentosus]